MPARYWIGTSWKMNKLLSQAQAYADTLAASEADNLQKAGIQRFVIPSFTNIRAVRQRLADSTTIVGAQNMHWADDGAWTGEVSADMIRDCGAEIVELGHSERRAHFGETDETVALKTETALRHGLIPLICIGETRAEREAGRASAVLETQVRAALSRLSSRQKTERILFAYEPVWAIGEHGIPATTDYAEARHAEIAAVAQSLTGRKIPVLYGGSVNAQNCVDLIRCPHVDGLFIGRAALQVEGYIDILQKCAASIQDPPDKGQHR